MATVQEEGMSLAKIYDSEEPDFCWGKKRGVGGKKKEVQFYESFTYDGVEYNLYDCVYLYYKQNEELPFIGKLIKIWENADKSKRVKIHWFFRASEISHWLITHNLEALENELFFATGEGSGLANVNPLEAIAGKCFVVCTSRDSRNPQPSAEHLQMADYVFYRTFDVGQCIILDKMDDKVGGLEVRYVFNRQENEMSTGPKIGSEPIGEDNRIVVVFEETLQLSGTNPHKFVESIKRDGDHNDLVVKEDIKAKYLLVKEEPSAGHAEDASGNLKSTRGKRPAPVVDVLTTDVGTSIRVKENSPNANDAKEQAKDSTLPANQVEVRETSEYDPDSLGCRPSKKAKSDNGAKVIKGKAELKGREDLKISSADSFKEKRKPDIGEDLVGLEKDTKSAEGSSALDDRPSKKPKVQLVKLSEVKKNNHMEKTSDGSADVFKDKKTPDTRKDLVGVEDAKFAKDSSALDDRPSKKPVVQDVVKLSEVEKKNHLEKNTNGREVKGSLVVGSSVDNERESMLPQKSTWLDDGPSKEKPTSKIKKLSQNLIGLEKIDDEEIPEQKVIHLKNMSQLTKNSSKGDNGPPEKTRKLIKMSSKLDKGPSQEMPDEKRKDQTRKLIKMSSKLDNGPSQEMPHKKRKKHIKDSLGLDKGKSKEKPNETTSVHLKSCFGMDKGPSFGMDGFDKGPSKEKLNAKTSVPMKVSSSVNKDHSLGMDGFDTDISKGALDGKTSEPMKSSFAMEKGHDGFEKGPSKDTLDRKTSAPMKSSFTLVKGLSEKKLNTKSSMLPDDNLAKISKAFDDVGKRYEVMRRPNAEKGKWYKSSWVDVMVTAHKERRLVLLENLDPEYTSEEVEDIIWNAFKETCTAKMVQRTAFCSPHYGQALVVLRTRDAAERVVGKLNDGCLIISNQRPLVGSIANLPQSPGEQSTFVGHLFIDKVKLQMQREKKDALSTSHYSQPNTIEYELALEWRLLQSRADFCWESLHKCQDAELSKCIANFKPNSRNDV